MRITAVETFVLTNRHALVKVSTDEGVSGWGECTLENWVRTVTAAVERMTEHLLGADPLHITALWQTLARGGYYRGGPVLSSAVAGIDQALWDIKGRWHDVPVHELLGGPTRDTARIYAHANRPGATGDPVRAAEHVAAGLDLIKVAPQSRIEFLESPDRLVADLAAVREAVGGGVDIAVDLHGRCSVPQSRRLLPLLAPLGIAFAEEPLRPEHSDLVGTLVDCSPVPIATGERLYSRTDFRRVLEAGVALVQPDVSHAGGITECFRIATQAETYDARIAPHSPIGPVALAACLQLAFAVPNFYAQEQSLNLHLGPSDSTAVLDDPSPLTPVDGHIPRLTGPGLGITVDEDAVRAAVDHGPLTPGSPTWHHPDGSFAEW
ncbi:galactonate dehydratase [Actinophytocola oryzae]|uniref:Galactonate dehydratase n=1 Tax=Actinophytocola oryzae TaxID=502181 RepID=A0A4R7W4X5_9PSEU|nr:galactonate dehydratase [Actinophytocola oryzae]TDV57654.1 galactonate dehydratase [Actinophytocola oryzae]